MQEKCPHPWLVFTLVAIAQFMVILDSSITNVALPSIQRELHFLTNSSLQWVVTGYALTFGGFLLFGGRAADLFGRRRMLLLGMAAFTLCSFLIGISQSATMLIVLRALQGLAAAFMSPAALSIVLSVFEEGPKRGLALGLWSTVATGGAAMGLLVGGLLTQFLGWQWNFFINVPIGIVMLVAIARIVPRYESDAGHTHLDLSGAALSTVGLMAFVYAVSRAPFLGWLSPATLGTAALAIILIVLFIWNESRKEYPLIPLSIFKVGNVAGANLIMAPVFASMLSIFFLTTLYVQGVLHYSPLITGLAFLPFPFILGFTSSRVPALVARYGYKRFLLCGPVLIALGLWWLSRLPVDGVYLVHLLPAFIVLPFGIGMMFMPIVAAATAGIPRDEAGLASGLITTSQQMGGALGLAIISGIASVPAGITSAQGLVTAFDKGYTAALVFVAFAFLIALTLIKETRHARVPFQEAVTQV
ncbi:MAG: MFS transporter [Patescibacteria group bacterium]|nr:MFS transporter [Patescibacteria group bacterium]